MLREDCFLERLEQVVVSDNHNHGEIKMKGRKKLVVGVSLLILAGAVIAAGYSGSCGVCGNSNDDRAYNTAQFLANFDALMGGGNTIKIGDTVKVSGGDGTQGVYQKYSQYMSIRFGCVSNCGSGDSSPYFVPPEKYDFQPF